MGITMAFLLTSLLSLAQLKGSGKMITQSYDYSNFDKLSFQNLDGQIEVEIGKTWRVLIEIDDNLAPLLEITENKSEHELKMAIKNNLNNRLYIEDTNIKIKIIMPEVSEIEQHGNSNLVVNDVVGRYFRIENSGNGTAEIKGSIDELEIINRGNGNTKAKNLLSKNATVKCSGNGNASVNVSQEITAKASGNSSVFNYGKAKFNAQSTFQGNARLIQK